MKVFKLEEMRKLVKVKVYKIRDNQYSFNLDGGRSFSFTGTFEEMAKFLKRIQAKDNISSPRSNRKLTYLQMAIEIDSQKDNTVFCWLHNLNRFKKRNYTINDM